MMQQYQEAKERHPGMLLLFQNGELLRTLPRRRRRRLARPRPDADQPREDDPDGGLPHAGPRSLSLASCCTPAIASPSATRSRTPRWPRGWSSARSPASSRRAPSPKIDLLDPRRSNYLVSLSPGHGKGPAGASWVDLSTGQFHAADVPSEKLADELGRLAPAEVLHSDAPGPAAEAGPLLSGLRELLPNLSVTPRPDWTFDPDSARAALHAPLRRHHPGRLRLRRPSTVPRRGRGAAAVPARDAEGGSRPSHANCGRGSATAFSSSTR